MDQYLVIVLLILGLVFAIALILFLVKKFNSYHNREKFIKNTGPVPTNYVEAYINAVKHTRSKNV